MKKPIIGLPDIIVLVCITFSCTNSKSPAPVDISDLQHSCVHRLTDVIVYDIFTPPVASRIYAYCNLAYYEAIRWKDPVSISLIEKLKGFDTAPRPDENKEYLFTLSAIKSFFKVAKALTFSKDSLVKTEQALLHNLKKGISPSVYENSIVLGDTIASIILKRAAADNYKQSRGLPRYSVFKEPGKWQQTPPDYMDAVEPHWNLIRPLLLDSASQFKPEPPPVYNLDKNSLYYKELMEVYEVSNQITPAQDSIARYWDDNPFVTGHEGHLLFATKKTTPGGHWMGIISILCRQTGTDDVRAAKIFALTSCAMLDGFISCWDEKYRSRMVRPVTVIREHINPVWNPLLQTPPFPEYTSGHSVITSAAATVLTHLLGENLAFHDTTEMEYLGLERSFSSIQQAADEAGISRLYGGIHYRVAIEEGKKQGQQVGRLYNSIFN